MTYVIVIDKNWKMSKFELTKCSAKMHEIV